MATGHMPGGGSWLLLSGYFWGGAQVAAPAPPHMLVLFRMSPSVMVHLMFPALNCSEPLPLGGDEPAERLPRTRRPTALCPSTKLLPELITLPVPVNVVPEQQKMY